MAAIWGFTGKTKTKFSKRLLSGNKITHATRMFRLVFLELALLIDKLKIFSNFQFFPLKFTYKINKTSSRRSSSLLFLFICLRNFLSHAIFLYILFEIYFIRKSLYKY